MDVYEICGYHLVSMSSSNGEITFFLYVVTRIPSSILRSAFFQIFTLTRFACYMNVNFQYTKKTSKRDETTWLKYDIHVKLQSQMINQNLFYSSEIEISASKFYKYTFLYESYNTLEIK